MHKLNSASTAPGATLLRKLQQGTLAKLHHVSEAPASQRSPGGLYAPLIAVRKAAQPLPTSGKKPAPLTVKPPSMRAPGEGADFEAGLNLDDPRHVHALQLRQSAAAHAALVASVKAAQTPHPHGSTGPEPL